MPNHKKPTKLKKVQGSYRKDRELDNAMEFEPVKRLPDCPVKLEQHKYAVEIWNEASEELYNLKMLYKADRQLLMAYCVEMSKYWECQDDEIECSLTYSGEELHKVKSSFARAALLHINVARAIAGEFGFTPSSRTKISMPKQKPNDPMEALMEKYK